MRGHNPREFDSGRRGITILKHGLRCTARTLRSYFAPGLLALAFIFVSARSARAQDLTTRFSSRGAVSAPASSVSPSHTTTRLLADTKAIEPGLPFRVGVLFTMEPEWHIYWRSPGGEVGLPTTINWTLPEGFKAGEIQWPNPERFEDATVGVSFGYGHEVLLSVVVTPPATFPPGSKFKIKADSEWLACKTECIPGNGADELELPVGKAAPSDAAALFGGYSARVPRLAGDLDEFLTASLAPSEVRLKPNGQSDLRLELKARDPWRFLLEADDTKAMLFHDKTTDLELTAPPGASSTSGEREAAGRKSYEGLTFTWNLKALDDASPAQVMLADAMTIPVVNPGTGQQQTLYLLAPHALQIEGGTKPVTAPVPLASEPAKPAPGDGPIFSFMKEGTPGGSDVDSLWKILLFAFIGGLILNVMPCVLPVLSIKILGFVRQAGDDPRRILRQGLVFAGGVFFSFAVLAALVVGVKSAGSQIGWGFQLQEPRFVIFLSAVIFAFGLSLFGVFEVALPGSATGGLDSLQRKEGAAGAFFNGMLATLLATPCTAPFLAPALGFAFAQPAAIVFLIFGAVASGLSAPYVLLSARPGWLRFVPKAGPWMDTFKQSMGFLLMGTTVWLLWVLGQQTGSDGVTWTLCFLLALSLGCWLLGKGLDFQATPTRRWGGIGAAAVIVITAYLYFPESYLSTLSSVTSASPTTSPTTEGGIPWQPFSVETVEKLAAKNQTIFADFTADWCLTCKVNEKTVLATEEVIAAFRAHNVAALRADYTRRQPELTRILQLFGRAGVPMYVIFPAGRPGEPIVLPTLLTPALVKEKLAEASTVGSKIAAGPRVP